MPEAFSFQKAFETVVVGILAIPWVILLLDLLQPDAVMKLLVLLDLAPEKQLSEPTRNNATDAPKTSELPISRATISGGLIILLAYVLGSAMTPIATEMIREDIAFIDKVFPNEKKLRENVIFQESRWIHPAAFDALSTINKLPPEGTNNSKRFMTQEDFIKKCGSMKTSPKSQEFNDCSYTADSLYRILSGTLLYASKDAFSQLAALRDQYMVLRGTTVNAAFLLLITIFALSAEWRSKIGWLSLVPAGAVAAWATFGICSDICKAEVDDPPVFEAILLLIAMSGIVVWFRSSTLGRRPYRSMALTAGVATLLFYGAWNWTYVIYTKQVIRAYYVLKVTPQQDRRGSAIELIPAIRRPTNGYLLNAVYGTPTPSWTFARKPSKLKP